MLRKTVDSGLLATCLLPRLMSIVDIVSTIQYEFYPIQSNPIHSHAITIAIHTLPSNTKCRGWKNAIANPLARKERMFKLTQGSNNTTKFRSRIRFDKVSFKGEMIKQSEGDDFSFSRNERTDSRTAEKSEASLNPGQVST